MSDSRATSFGAEADSCEAARPDYPFEAVPRVVAEARDGEVVAIDPDALMLAKLREQVPGVPLRRDRRSESERAGIRRGMDGLFDELGLAGESTVDVPYVTWAFRALRG